MKNDIDAATSAVGLGLGRRDLLKTIAAVCVGSVIGRREASASDVVIPGEPLESQAVELYVQGGSLTGPTRMVIRDRQPARIIKPGSKQVTLIPHVMANMKGIELSIYDGASMKLDKRLPIVFGAAPTPVAGSLLAGMSFHAPRLVPFAGTGGGTDCCVTCCSGQTICASGVCCNTNDSSCGACCDYGSCQPNCDCCAPPA